MREIKDNKPVKGSSEYRRPGTPPRDSRYGMFPGSRVRWTTGAGLHRTRDAAMRERRRTGTRELPKLVHV